MHFGYRAGWQSDASDNTFIGSEAGAYTTGSDNTFVGAEAGENNTSGEDNTFVGEESGFLNTTGTDNTFVGEDAGGIIITGSENTAIGASAMRGGTSPSPNALGGASYNNTAIGTRAGYDIGTASGGLPETTYNNTFVGSHAGQDLGAGHVNTFLGAQAGKNTEWSDYCTFVGAGAGWDNNRNNGQSTGNRNSYFGMAAGMRNRQGSDNVAVGAFADFASWDGISEAALTDAFDNDGIAGFTVLGSGGVEFHRTVILGSYASCRDDDAIAMGFSADSTKERAIALGSGAQATHTDSIVMYLESIEDSRAFMSAARAFARHKPIIALKSGRYETTAISRRWRHCHARHRRPGRTSANSDTTRSNSSMNPRARFRR